jgi:membrane associated rhomboid family serine protease
MYEDSYEEPSVFTPAVKWLITMNILVFVMQFLRGQFMEYWFALWPNFHSGYLPVSVNEYYAVNSFRPWQLITYAFLHSTSSISHILFNMIGLWMFGKPLELTVGTKRFTIFYLTCVLGGALTHLAYAHVVGSPFPMLGASGGVFGLLLAYGMLFPREKVFMLFIPVPIEARFFVILYGLLELFNGISNVQGGVAHFAHLGGMLFGIFVIQYWRGSFPFSKRKIF